ncbi:MAG TPA: hypothetical protein VGP73_26480 [Thermoanaerobaculia bacterium]
MRKNAARILGLLITVLALAAPSHKAEAASGACTLLCVQGYHCVVQGDTQTCVPN